MGAATPSARSRFARRIPVAAAPALLGVAAAVIVSSAPAGHPAGQSHPAAAPAAVLASAAAAGTAPAELLAFTKQAARAGQPARPARYTVRAGDTLSAIAKRLYHSDRYWPVLYWANHKQIRYADQIRVGQALVVPAKPAKIPAPPSATGPAPAPASPAGASYAQASPSGYGRPQSTAVTGSTASAGGGGSFQACVIARESGGNSQAMNATGHYGLYQFSASTWSAYGGSAADFGHASVAEQNQVFGNAVAAGGQSNWSPYDGC